MINAGRKIWPIIIIWFRHRLGFGPNFWTGKRTLNPKSNQKQQDSCLSFQFYNGMCPNPDGPTTAGPTSDEMVPIETNAPPLPPPSFETNGHSEPPTVKSHKGNGAYGRASDFLSNTSNWKVGLPFKP